MKLPAAGLTCLIFIAFAYRADGNANKWKLLKSKDHISSFSGTPNDKGITPTMVEMTTHASPERVVSVIADMANYKLWVPYCKTSVLVQKASDNVCYGYQRVSAPLVKDRDMVLCCTVSKTGTTYEILIVAAPNFLKPGNGAIRIQHLNTHYQIYPDASGTTHIIQVSEVDIGGSIPMFLLNWLSKYQPYETCQKLREVMERK